MDKLRIFRILYKVQYSISWITILIIGAFLFNLITSFFIDINNILIFIPLSIFLILLVIIIIIGIMEDKYNESK
jgi:hypothetical protein